MSAFWLRGKLFNEDRNNHQYTIGTALKTNLYLGYLLAKKAELQSCINNLDIVAEIKDLSEIEREHLN